jgi:hypothetical protein
MIKREKINPRKAIAPHRLGTILLLALTVLMTPACTTRAWYEGIQATAKQACRREPLSEQERCESRLNKADFEAYQKNRPR